MASVFPWQGWADLSLPDKWIFFSIPLHGQHCSPTLVEIHEPRPWGQSPKYELCSCCSDCEQGAPIGSLRLHLLTCVMGDNRVLSSKGCGEDRGGFQDG